MDLTKVVLSHINNFEEVDELKKELNNLPPNYEPFPDLNKDCEIGAILFDNHVYLSPMMGKNQFYDGNINHPDESREGESIFRERDNGIVPGAKFSYKGRKFVLYRTEAQHKSPLNLY